MRTGRFEEAETEAKEGLRLALRVTTPTVKNQIFSPDALHVMQEILLATGRPQEALDLIEGRKANQLDGSVNLAAALAYCQLGDLRRARSRFSDGSIRMYFPKPQSFVLPGTGDLKSLEASIHLARGLDRYFSGDIEREGGARELIQAARLAPENGFVAYWTGKTLTRLHRPSEASPYYAVAARTATGSYLKEAAALLTAGRNWMREHPESVTPQGRELKPFPMTSGRIVP